MTPDQNGAGGKVGGFKFERLDVWKLSLEYLNLVYQIADRLPKREEYNLKSQIVRAATSIALNIAEGSTSQTNAEQGRFLGMSIRSLIETVACLHLIERRKYVEDELLIEAHSFSQRLFSKLQAFRRALERAIRSAT